MRLRPSGNKGPVATRLRAFEKYQLEEAWTWEHMALSRARLIAGDESLIAEAEAIIATVLAREPDVKKITTDVAEMRRMIDKEKPPRDIWDVKLIPGGLVDIEFVAQYFSLIAPAEGIGPEGREPGTRATLDRLGPAFLAPADLDELTGALALYSDIAQAVRLCIDGPFDPKTAPEGLKDFLCRITELPDLRVLEGEVKRRAEAVRAIFRATVR